MKEHVAAFYRFLETHPQIRQEALNLQKIHPDQERLIHAFLDLARRCGFEFTLEEYVSFLYEKAEEIPPEKK